MISQWIPEINKVGPKLFAPLHDSSTLPRIYIAPLQCVNFFPPPSQHVQNFSPPVSFPPICKIPYRNLIISQNNKLIALNEIVDK